MWIFYGISCSATDGSLTLLDSEMGNIVGSKLKGISRSNLWFRLCYSPSGIERMSFNLASMVART